MTKMKSAISSRLFLNAILTMMLLASLVSCALKDTERSFKEIVVLRGLNFQEYFIRTKDDYVLSVFRISGKLMDPKGIQAWREASGNS
jgi:hypothetical protein